MSLLSPSLRPVLFVTRPHPARLTIKRTNHPVSPQVRRSQHHVPSHPTTDQQPNCPPSPRIHILGTGNIGAFIAHQLRLLPSPPPVTFLFHRESLLETWNSKAEMTEVIREGVSTFSSGFDIELVNPTHSAAPSAIENLIIAVKAPTTVPALRPILHRLTPRSTLLFLQNGMGVIDQVRAELFPSTPKDLQPHYASGILTHGINSTAPFTLTHAGLGALALRTPSPGSPRHLQNTLLRSPPINATLHPPAALLQLQWEKLAVNAVVNPLTALFNIPNGDILAPSFTPAIRALVAEISAVVHALPEMPSDMKQQFSPERLEERVRSVAGATAANVSSMLQDVRKGKRTEVEYITGYIVRRGEEVGVACEENRRVMRAVVRMEGLVRRVARRRGIYVVHAEGTTEEPPRR